MKQLLLILAFLPPSLFAQNWLPDAAQWHHGYAWGTAAGYVRTTVIGDTLVNGTAGRRLERTRVSFDLVGQSYFTESLTDLVCTNENGLISVYDPSIMAYDTLYDMNAVPGDRWELPILPEPLNCTADSWMQVVDTGTTVIDEIPLRWLVVDVNFVSDEPSVYRDTVLERVGLTGMYFLPHDFCNSFVDGQEAGRFRCYTDSEILVIADPAIPCELTVGIQGLKSALEPLLYPNPSAGLLYFNLPDELAFASLQLYDATGRMVHSSRITRDHWLDLNHLPDGLFYYRIIPGSNAAETTGVWVKTP